MGDQRDGVADFAVVVHDLLRLFPRQHVRAPLLLKQVPLRHERGLPPPFSPRQPICALWDGEMDTQEEEQNMPKETRGGVNEGRRDGYTRRTIKQAEGNPRSRGRKPLVMRKETRGDVNKALFPRTNNGPQIRNHGVSGGESMVCRGLSTEAELQQLGGVKRTQSAAPADAKKHQFVSFFV